ncbi:MAG: gliding motility ABC transporter auxillary protein [Gallionellaceae bacterium]|nr:MAG: gliding motility ABC transporter auxillary protein [Gallionellaceae bacterium]
MKSKSWFVPLGILSVLLVAAGGITFAITGEMGNLPVSLIWVGLLGLLLFFYIYFPEIREFITKRSTKYAFNTAIMSAVFFLIILLIGVMSIKYKTRIDLTENHRYTLSSQTIKILKSLKEDVEAIAFYRSDERTRQAMFDLLSEYSYHSPKFSFHFVDPDRDPSEAVKYGITSYRTTLLKYGNKQEIVGTESENKLTNSIIKLINKDVKVIYFVKGHGEKNIESEAENGYTQFKEAIEKENHQVRDLMLLSAEKVPDDAAVLVISGPETDYLPGELDKITAFVKKGGRMLFMLDPGGAPGLAKYLGGFGFEISGEYIIDKMSQVYGANFLMPVVGWYYKNHPLTSEFDLATFFPIAGSVHIKEDPSKGSYDLAKTSDKSWAVSGKLTKDDEEFNPDKHKRGPISMAAVTAVEVNIGGGSAKEGPEDIKTWGKILVVGDSDFTSNKFLKTAGNRDFALNALNWLAEENVLISIRKKEAGQTPLMLSAVQGKIVFWLSVVIVPSLLLAVGVGVAARRKRSA